MHCKLLLLGELVPLRLNVGERDDSRRGGRRWGSTRGSGDVAPASDVDGAKKGPRTRHTQCLHVEEGGEEDVGGGAR